jgi:hypothetical protein
LSFCITYGIWTGRGWSWLFSFILATDAVVVGGFGLLLGSFGNAIPIAIYVLIYLALPSVRVYFGRSYSFPTAVFPPAPASWPPVPYPTSASPQYTRSVYVAPSQKLQYPGTQPSTQRLGGWQPAATCACCGNSLPYGSGFCGACGTALR